ncbi:LysR substrate-binding domain-containing protein [Plastoroseomonas hellenica]|uniref:LysR substrate-binding domain-containing protein n=1 Tax=Plastoroseomonas hellenica TaxID=2687306 RepID=UPI001BADB3D1|nr:LysR substrate-binding domain-containing protein [Plastoroseomonas hellenica]
MNSIQSFERLPLVALRSFESFARLGDIAAAASELGITPSAVSHQLHALETALGMAVTERRGRRLGLSDEGRRYFEAVRPAFILLTSATAQIRQNTLPPRITISALPLLATGWLVPRLERFLAAHSDVAIQVQYARYRNYSSDAADVSLRFGTGDWPGYASEKLLSGTAYPVASRTFVARHGPFATLTDFLAAPLIHDGTSEQWTRWLSDAGLAPSAALKGMVCEDGMLTRSAMLAGIGVALTRPDLLEAELQDGRLLVVSERGVDDGQDYYLCVRSDQNPSPAVRQLAAWLRRSLTPVPSPHG